MVKIKVRLEILSKDELNDLENDIVRLEKLGNRKRNAESKIGRRKGKKSGIFAGEGGEALPSTVLKRRRKAVLDRVADAKNALSSDGKISSGTLTNSASPIERSNAFKKLQKQVSLNQKATRTLSKSLGLLGQGTELARGSFGGVTSIGIGLASRILPAGIIIAIAKQVMDIWIQSYGAGGVNDPRKKILNDVSSFIGLERETDIISGKQFFANSRTLKQGQEFRSNTENLRDGFARTRLLRSPYGRG